MSGAEKDFDARLAALFEEAAPPVDAGFTKATMDALPPAALTRPLVLALAGLAGTVLAGLQLPSLIPAAEQIMAVLGSAAVETIGYQAVIMALAAAGLTAATMALFRRGGMDL